MPNSVLRTRQHKMICGRSYSYNSQTTTILGKHSYGLSKGNVCVWRQSCANKYTIKFNLALFHSAHTFSYRKWWSWKYNYSNSLSIGFSHLQKGYEKMSAEKCCIYILTWSMLSDIQESDICRNPMFVLGTFKMSSEKFYLVYPMWTNVVYNYTTTINMYG